MNNLFVYVLNSYRERSSTHFSHIPNLLVNISRLNVAVVLLIEKCDGSPPVIEGVKVLVLKNSGSRTSIIRLFHLFRIIFNWRKLRPLVFVRITSISSLVVSAALLGSRGESVLWQSGATYEWDMSQAFSIKKVLWLFKSYLPGLLARKSCSVFTTGPRTMVDYYEQVHGVYRGKIKCLYNDVNTDAFRPSDQTVARNVVMTRYGIDIKHDDFCVLIVHSLSPVRSTYKYIPRCIDRLMSEHPNLKVLMVGDGSERSRLELAVSKKDWSANFFFLGSVANQELPVVYSSANCFLQPSQVEGFPRVLIEAMSCGLPFVSTDAGGVRDISPDWQQNYVVDRNDLAGLESALESILDLGSNELRELGLLNREYCVNNFDTKVIARMYVNTLFS